VILGGVDGSTATGNGTVQPAGQSHLALYWFEVYEQGFEERVVPSGALEFAFHGAL
jgi:hypothetical protein